MKGDITDENHPARLLSLEATVVLVDPSLIEREDGAIIGSEGLCSELPLLRGVVKLDAIYDVFGQSGVSLDDRRPRCYRRPNGIERLVRHLDRCSPRRGATGCGFIDAGGCAIGCHTFWGSGFHEL